MGGGGVGRSVERGGFLWYLECGCFTAKNVENFISLVERKSLLREAVVCKCCVWLWQGAKCNRYFVRQ